MSKITSPFRLVITGAPASGKTTCFEALRGHPQFSDFKFFDELARKLLEENPDYRNDWGAFHREIYRLQIQREKEAARGSFVTDRGTADAFAFHPETAADVGTTIENEHQRYSAVIHLGSSANLGERYYAVDEIRNETITDAQIIEAAITKVWQGHPRYHYLPAEKNIEIKVKRFVSLTVRLISE